MGETFNDLRYENKRAVRGREREERLEEKKKEKDRKTRERERDLNVCADVAVLPV